MSQPNAYSVADMGPWEKLPDHAFQHPKFERPARGKVFLRPLLELTGMEVSLNCVPPGRGIPFLHRHREHEELYLFVRGTGQFQVDGQVFPVREGTAVRVAPSATRAFRNDSKENLYFLVVQAPANSFQGDSISDGVPVEGAVSWPDPK
jgi:mannose-6-phosphate isomerase-like protein (cupin superfamily)